MAQSRQQKHRMIAPTEKRTLKADYIRNAYDMAEQRKYMPPHPENKMPLTTEYSHLLRSKREFGGGLAGTPEEASNFRFSLSGQRRADLEYAIYADDDSGDTQGSRDYLHYMELYNHNHDSPINSPVAADAEEGEPSHRRSSSSSSSSSDSSNDDSSAQFDRLTLDTSSTTTQQ